MLRKEVKIPEQWCIPCEVEAVTPPKLRKDIIDWCVCTGITADRRTAEKAVDRLNPYMYMKILFPKLKPDEPLIASQYELNASVIVTGYIMDDVLETYTLSAIEELDHTFKETENWLLSLPSKDYPDLDAILDHIPTTKPTYSRSVVAMFTDYFNKYCAAIRAGYKPPDDRLRRFRARLAAAVTAYLEMAKRKRRRDGDLDEEEFLWQRSADNLSFPVLMLAEVFTGVLANGEIPNTTLHYYHFYSNLFAIVLNDLNSYHRDRDNDDNSLVKLWLKLGVAEKFEDAAAKTVDFLNSIIVRMYVAMTENSESHPKSESFRRFREAVGYTFNGWILVHTTAVERYKSSPFQTVLSPVARGAEEAWLKSETAFGKRCVTIFEELISRRVEEMNKLYGLDST